VAHLRFILLWYTNFIRLHASDILLFIHSHIRFYCDGINHLFQNYKHKLIPIQDKVPKLSVRKAIINNIQYTDS
jgi:hypothetical protein